jgi:acylglycerol lipase
LYQRPVLLYLVFAFLAGCAPQFIQGGDRTATPVLEENRLATADRILLPVRTWRSTTVPAKAILVALHGFNDYSNAFDEPATWWSEAGITVYAYDQRGFGRAPHTGIWSDTRTMSADLEDAIAAIAHTHPELPIYLLGSSMGGAVILNALGGNPRPIHDLIRGAVLVGPAVWGPTTMNPLYQTALWLGAHTIPSHQMTGRGLKIRASDNVPMLRKLGRDPLIIKSTRIDTLYGLVQLMGDALDSAPALRHPTLVLGAGNDQLIPGHAHRELLETLRNERTEAIYPDGYHMLLRDLGAKTVWRDILYWIRDRNAPLPSGFGRKINDLKATVR